MRFSLILIVLSLSLSLTAKDFHKKNVLELAVSDITLLGIDCGAGFLKISGNEKSDFIIVEADICVESDSEEEFHSFLKKSLKLSLKEKNGKAVLKSGFDGYDSFFSLFDNSFNARIDLTIKVPEKIKLMIDEGSGSTEIKNLKNDIFIDDGSGSLIITNIKGNINIDDGSGDAILNEISGNVIIDDGSGSITINKINGSVVLDDGAGEAEISDVTGDITVDDGAGGIKIDRVGGDVIIKDSGSGSLDISNVKGQIFRHDRED